MPPPRSEIKRRTPESCVLSSILSLLTAYRILAFRMNTGVANFSGRRVKFGTPGMADILAFPHGRVLWIECKSDEGRQSYDQKMFEQVVRPEGHGYIIARSIDDVLPWLLERLP